MAIHSGALPVRLTWFLSAPYSDNHSPKPTKGHHNKVIAVMHVNVLVFMLPPRGELGAEGPVQSNHCERTGRRVRLMRVRVRLEAAGCQVKLLIFVDDEPSIRLTLPPLLEARGFQVTAASSVPEALALIKEQEFDVLLCDLNIDREADGFTVVHAVREANPNCITILLTAYPAFDTAVRSIRQEVDDYFTKPADLNELVRTIDRKLLARGLQRKIPPKTAATAQSG
jgi:ActR/RegA family two-component response regulator